MIRSSSCTHLRSTHSAAWTTANRPDVMQEYKRHALLLCTTAESVPPPQCKAEEAIWKRREGVPGRTIPPHMLHVQRSRDGMTGCLTCWTAFACQHPLFPPSPRTQRSRHKRPRITTSFIEQTHHHSFLIARGQGHCFRPDVRFIGTLY